MNNDEGGDQFRKLAINIFCLLYEKKKSMKYVDRDTHTLSLKILAFLSRTKNVGVAFSY